MPRKTIETKFEDLLTILTFFTSDFQTDLLYLPRKYQVVQIWNCSRISYGGIQYPALVHVTYLIVSEWFPRGHGRLEHGLEAQQGKRQHRLPSFHSARLHPQKTGEGRRSQGGLRSCRTARKPLRKNSGKTHPIRSFPTPSRQLFIFSIFTRRCSWTLTQRCATRCSTTLSTSYRNHKRLENLHRQCRI